VGVAWCTPVVTGSVGGGGASSVAHALVGMEGACARVSVCMCVCARALCAELYVCARAYPGVCIAVYVRVCVSGCVCVLCAAVCGPVRLCVYHWATAGVSSGLSCLPPPFYHQVIDRVMLSRVLAATAAGPESTLEQHQQHAL
jgi:hypothetical protein